MFVQHRLNIVLIRHITRLMERDNKKARDSARKEYNETVKVWRSIHRRSRSDDKTQ